MNEFLKYLKMIPVIIYPYIYVLILAVFFLFVGVLPEDTTDISLLVLSSQSSITCIPLSS